MTRIDARTAARLASPGDRAELARSDGERSMATQLRRLNVPPFVTEHRFDSVRAWRFDFAWPELLVALEVEGGSWVGGRHVNGTGFEQDCVKYSEASIAGWLVLRVTTDMVDDGRAVNLATRALWVAGNMWRDDAGVVNVAIDPTSKAAPS